MRTDPYCLAAGGFLVRQTYSHFRFMRLFQRAVAHRGDRMVCYMVFKSFARSYGFRVDRENTHIVP